MGPPATLEQALTAIVDPQYTSAATPLPLPPPVQAQESPIEYTPTVRSIDTHPVRPKNLAPTSQPNPDQSAASSKPQQKRLELKQTPDGPQLTPHGPWTITDLPSILSHRDFLSIPHPQRQQALNQFLSLASEDAGKKDGYSHADYIAFSKQAKEAQQKLLDLHGTGEKVGDFFRRTGTSLVDSAKDIGAVAVIADSVTRPTGIIDPNTWKTVSTAGQAFVGGVHDWNEAARETLASHSPTATALDTQLTALHDDLENGNFPLAPAQFQAWLAEKSTQLESAQARHYAYAASIPTSLSPAGITANILGKRTGLIKIPEPTLDDETFASYRSLAKNPENTLLLGSYLQTRDPQLWQQIKQRLFEIPNRTAAKEELQAVLQSPGAKHFDSLYGQGASKHIMGAADPVNVLTTVLPFLRGGRAIVAGSKATGGAVNAAKRIGTETLKGIPENTVLGAAGQLRTNPHSTAAEVGAGALETTLQGATITGSLGTAGTTAKKAVPYIFRNAETPSARQPALIEKQQQNRNPTQSQPTPPNQEPSKPDTAKRVAKPRDLQPPPPAPAETPPNLPPRPPMDPGKAQRIIKNLQDELEKRREKGLGLTPREQAGWDEATAELDRQKTADTVTASAEQPPLPSQQQVVKAERPLEGAEQTGRDHGREVLSPEKQPKQEVNEVTEAVLTTSPSSSPDPSAIALSIKPAKGPQAPAPLFAPKPERKPVLADADPLAPSAQTRPEQTLPNQHPPQSQNVSESTVNSPNKEYTQPAASSSSRASGQNAKAASGKGQPPIEFQNRTKTSTHSHKPPPGFDWGRYLRSKIGPPLPGMLFPHAHHILFKEGLGPAQQALVQEGQAILRRHGIDPIYGVENLVWAPNKITGQHHGDALKHVVETLRIVEAAGEGYDGMVDALKKLGKLAAKRK
jgi:hypothetical protein